MANIKNTIFVVSFLEAWLAQATPLFGKDYVNAILHQIWKPMVMHFHVDRPTPQPQTHSSMYGAARQEFGTLDKDVRLAMTLARLLTGISRDDIPVDSCELIEAIRKDTTRMAPTVLRQILLPFLRHALPWATAAVQDQKFTTPLRDMYQTGLNAYLKSYVKSQPQQGGGFSRPRLHCSCNHCWDVNIFLASATQQVGRFRLSKNARHHVHAYLDNAGFDGTHQTERTWVEPQTLVVTKRNRQGETYNAWLARCREAHGGLHRFEAEGLRKVLSEPVMKDIMAMRCIINDPPAAPEFLPRYVADVVEQPAATRAGVKRKAEVIDLSGDSD
ncbi:hypothetical protein Tdes44962_MAKER05937 [Teratosphaeria destructans]|uniref:Uncharacterized protein n=1 Tax=Teratosphaeria destructans TaxID=418781 RepID=A0A9W7SJ77_9PEZI|nr:hypothetical protein Tdes44962_MAKER05937 [Teratosphaeria destructans]